MNVEGEWRWFTVLRLALARAVFWTCCKLIAWSFKALLAPDHPMRIYQEGKFASMLPPQMAALRRPAGHLSKHPSSKMGRAAIIAVPCLVPASLLVPTSLLF